jgi:hypothetical protein
LQQGADFSSLGLARQLTALDLAWQDAFVGGHPIAGAVAALATLDGLQRLELLCAREEELLAVVALTGLTGLQQLLARGARSHRHGGWRQGEFLQLTSKVSTTVAK